jgi:uncharacterized heparinase superfamily protein
VGTWEVGHQRPSSLLDRHTFRFLNVDGVVRDAADWDAADRSRLWRYNAHYFDDLNAAGATSRATWHRALIAQWIAQNPAASGPGWESYPTSLRISNWIKWSVAAVAGGEPGLDAEATQSLATQLRWLSKRLEIHLLGNHLWTNAKALVFGGMFFSGDEGAAWLQSGIALVERELDEQILPDGGHFERSPMYQAIVLEDVLDLLNLARAIPDLLAGDLETKLRATAIRMHRWLRVMTHPDGQIALFNDAALAVAPSEGALSEYARRLRVPVDLDPLGAVEALPESGYVRLQNARAVVICDVGEVGPDYLPGHAHADTLSFELSLDGRRVIVDTGISTYDIGPERQSQRSTHAHNTVEVDQIDSSEVWGGFRVARRAHPLGVRWGSDTESLWLEGAHDGYRRTAGRVTHHRRWQLDESALTITDRLAGTYDSAVSALHLHPSVQVDVGRVKGSEATLVLAGDKTISLTAVPSAGLEVQSTTWHPEFGVSEKNTVLRVRFVERSLATRLKWR